MSFDNITFRKNDRIKFNLSDNFVECLDSEHTSLTDISNMSQTNILNTEQSQIILELQQEIEKLKKELSIAHKNVQRLSLENQELCKKMNNPDVKVQQSECYKTAASMSTRNHSETNHIKPDQLQIAQVNHTSTPIKIPTIRRNAAISGENYSNKSSLRPSQKVQQDSNNQKVATSTKDTSSNKEGMTTQTSLSSKHTIFILGDQQVRGLSSTLINSRKYKWNDKYNVCAFVKPNALSSEVLQYSDVLCNELQPNDKIVISIGSNDKNPYFLLKNLCLALQKLRKFNVYILQTESNRYMQENKLNNTIFSVVKTFRNCKYIKINKTIPSQNYLSQIANKLNIRIDSDDYEKQFTCQPKNNIRNFAINNNLIKDNKNQQIQSSYKVTPTKYRGTIPYFFEKQLEKIKSKQNNTMLPSQNNPIHSTNLLKKGTIPYYFERIQNKNTNTANQLFRK